MGWLLVASGSEGNLVCRDAPQAFLPGSMKEPWDGFAFNVVTKGFQVHASLIPKRWFIVNNAHAQFNTLTIAFCLLAVVFRLLPVPYSTSLWSTA
jgi:hypothetical protein